MKCGLFIPNFGEYFDLQFVTKLSMEAEKSGWNGLFVWDHIKHKDYSDFPTADPWIMLTAVALATRSIHFGPMVTPISRRRPWKLAKETVTLDHASGGRLIFGTGLGSQPLEFSSLGEEGNPTVKAERLDEGLAVLNGLWSGADFQFHGKHYDIQNTRFLPASFQKPRIPIWIGGYWPKKGPLNRAVHWDGYFPLGGYGEKRFLSPDEFRIISDKIANLRQVKEPFDLIASGYTDCNSRDSSSSSLMRAYEQAGATWWLEALDPWRFSLQDAQKRVRSGPPK